MIVSDFTIKREHSQILLTPETQRASEWCAAYLSAPKLGDAFIIAPDDFGEIATAILEDGLTVERTDMNTNVPLTEKEQVNAVVVLLLGTDPSEADTGRVSRFVHKLAYQPKRTFLQSVWRELRYIGMCVAMSVAFFFPAIVLVAILSELLRSFMPPARSFESAGGIELIALSVFAMTWILWRHTDYYNE